MKHILSLFTLAVLATIAMSSTSHAQGLAERRALKEYQDTKFKQIEADIDAAAGFDVKVSVDWEKIARPGEAENYAQDGYWTDIYFTPLIGALKSISRDDMGKTALKEKLKEVAVTFDESTAPASNYPNGLSFEGGKLTINFTPWSNSDDIPERQEAMVKILESNL